MSRTFLGISILILASLLLDGCSKKDKGGLTLNPPATHESQLTGAFLGSTESGLLDLTIEAAALTGGRPVAGSSTAPGRSGTGATVVASGFMHREGGFVVTLTGTYDPVTDSLRLGGQGYELVGAYLPPYASTSRMAGRFTGPNGNGAFVAFPGARSVVRAFCATYENSAATAWGAMNLVVSGGWLTGLEVADGNTAVVTLQGTVSGTGATKNLTFVGADFQGNGTWQTTTDHVSGSWLSGFDSGSWSGDPCLPGTTGSE